MKIFTKTSDLAVASKQIVISLNFIKHYAEYLHFEIITLIVVLAMNLLFLNKSYCIYNNLATWDCNLATCGNESGLHWPNVCGSPETNLMNEADENTARASNFLTSKI